MKGIADYADGTESISKNWSPFASVMAASVVAKILNDPIVFQEWPHYKGTCSTKWWHEIVLAHSRATELIKIKYARDNVHVIISQRFQQKAISCPFVV